MTYDTDTAKDIDLEWITEWAYWDYVGQEYIEWNDREILLNVGKLVRREADASPRCRSFHLKRLEIIMSKLSHPSNSGDRYTKLPEWVERESRA